MSFIDEYRKILKRRIREYHWDDIQTEIISFFDIIERVNIPDSAKYCIRKFELSKDKILEKFYLNERRIKDIIYIDRMYEMLKYIKEINFCFPNIWSTYNYHHHDHGYKLKSLLNAIENEVEDVIQFKTDKFDLLVENQEDFSSPEKFIDLNFADYGLPYYESYCILINGIAYHLEFYMILPHLLRSLFENLLQDIFSQSLDNSDTDLYYNKRNERMNDFSRLISLLELLKDKEFGPYVSGKMTKETINILNIIREIGNISIHDIGKKITPEFANEFRNKIKITLEPLLISYDKLKGKIPPIEQKRKFEIKTALRLIPKKYKIQNDKWKIIIQEEEISIDEKAVINSLSPDIADSEILKIRCNFEKSNWDEIRKKLEDQINNLFNEREHYQFAIFSLVHISYAMYLGYLLTNRVKIRYSQYQRDTGTWYWIKDNEDINIPVLRISGLLKKKKGKINEIVVKVSLTSKILDDQIKEIGLNVKDEIEITIENPSEDWLISETQVVELGMSFRDILNNIRIHTPNLKKIHLFYAGPTAGAIALGRQINSKMNAIIQLYEFDMNEVPRYQKSITIE